MLTGAEDKNMPEEDALLRCLQLQVIGRRRDGSFAIKSWHNDRHYALDTFTYSNLLTICGQTALDHIHQERNDGKKYRINDIRNAIKKVVNAIGLRD